MTAEVEELQEAIDRVSADTGLLPSVVRACLTAYAEGDKRIYWGVRLHPEDHSVSGGAWEAWDVLDYGEDKHSAQCVLKGLATRQLMKKVGMHGDWVRA